jgi:hypothetical protein
LASGAGVGAGAVSGVTAGASGAAAEGLATIGGGGGGKNRFEMSDHPTRMRMDSAKAATNRFSMGDLSAQSRGSGAAGVAEGTGSNPPSLQGLQRNTRPAARMPPFTAPWASTAWAAYSEHVGWNRQARGMNGDTNRL